MVLARRLSIWIESWSSAGQERSEGNGAVGDEESRCGEKNMPGSVVGFLGDETCPFAVCGHEFEVRLLSHMFSPAPAQKTWMVGDKHS